MRRRRIIGPGFPFLVTPIPAAAPPTYAGLFDVVAPTQSSYYGLRAANLAKALAGVPAINITNGLSQTGDIPVISSGGLNLSHSLLLAGGPFTLNRVYDQFGVMGDLIPGVAPNLVLNVFHGYPVVRFNGTTHVLQVSSYSSAIVQPFTISSFWNTINSPGVRQNIFTLAGGAATVQLLTSGTPAADVKWFCGSVLANVQSDGNFHAFQCVANNAGSPQGDMNVDGVVAPVPGPVGAGVLSDQTSFFVGAADLVGTFPFHGDFMELAIWGTGTNFSPTQSSLISANQHGFYGT